MLISKYAVSDSTNTNIFISESIQDANTKLRELKEQSPDSIYTLKKIIINEN